MSVITRVIIEDEYTKVVQFLWAKPVTAADLNERETIESALEDAIRKYAPSGDYLLFSAHKNPLMRLLSRIIIYSNNIGFPEIRS